MADIYKGLTIEIGGDTTKLSKALRDAQKESRGTATQIKQIEKALAMNPGHTALLAQQMAEYGKRVNSTQKELDVLRAAEEQLGQDDLGSEAWVKLQSDIALAENRLDQYNAALKQLAQDQAINNTALGQAANKVEAFGNRHEQAAKNLQSVGGVLTKTLTPAIIGTGAASIAAAVNIDSSLTSVRKTVDGTEEQYQQLKEAAIEFSKTNAVSASQILDIQALGAQLGFAIEELDMFSQVVSGLDIATDMDAETAATELAQFANITKMAHGDVENYASAIVGLGNNFATTESKVSAMAMRIAASGTQVGMSQADILGVATALTSLGVEAEAGGTAISTIMANIDKDIALGTDNMQVWASTAKMSAEKFAAAWANDPVQALSAVLSGMEEATTEGSNMSVMLDELGISSLRQTDVMKRLAGNSELMAEAVSAANEEWSANTALTKEVENRNSSLEAKFTMLKNEAIAVGESVGGPLADALLDVLDAARPLIDGISDAAEAFSDMDKEQQQVVLGAVGLVAAAGPLVSIAGKVLGSTDKIASGMRTLASLSPKVKKETIALADAQKTAALQGPRMANGLYAVEKSSKLATAGTKALNVAMGALKFAGAIAAFSAIASVIGTFTKASEDAANRTQRLKESNIDIIGSLNSAKAAYADAGQAAQDSASGIAAAAESTDEFLESQRELAQEINETWKTLGNNEASLESFTNTIMRLGEKSNLTESEQAQLAAAVKGFNDITGQSLSVIDPVNGALSEQKDAILAVKDAYIEQQRAMAAMDTIVKLENERAQAMEKLRIEQEKLASMDRGSGWDWTAGSLIETGDEAWVAWNRQNEIVQELQTSVNELNEEYGVANTVLSQTQGALNASSDAVRTLVTANQSVVDSLTASGQSVDDFSLALTDLGITQDELAQMTPETLSTLAEAWNGSNESIKPILDDYKLAVSDALDANTHEALLGMSDALAQGQALTEPQIETLRATLESATAGLDEETSANTWAAIDSILAAMSEGQPLEQAQVDQLNSILSGVGVQFPNVAPNNIKPGMSGIAAAINAGTGAVKTAANLTESSASDEFKPFPGEVKDYADQGTKEFSTAIRAGSNEAGQSGQILGQAALSNLGSISTYSTGYDFSAGYAQGISAGGTIVNSAARRVVNDALATIRSAQDSSSPSKKAGYLGEDFGEGYAVGIEKMERLVAKSSAGLVDTALTNVDQLNTLTDASFTKASKSIAPKSAAASNITYIIDGVTYTPDTQLARVAAEFYRVLESNHKMGALSHGI